MHEVAASVHDDPAFKAVLAPHTPAATVWVGGGCALAVRGFIGRRRTEAPQVIRDLERGGRLRVWCFAPASLALLGCGFGLVAIGYFSLRSLWLDLALGGWFIALVLSTGYLIPETEELGHLAARLGIDDEQTRRLVSRLRLVGSFETFVLILVVIDMVVRPA